ncbi:MAG TPA: helix-turn-helix domain-containing protein [Gaiellales bacterium]
MGEVGAKLRGERERRGIGIDEIEAETRIRAKFLLALEEERFDVLPGPAYVRAFVRDYAEQLGLDPQELVAELNARPDLVEDVVMTPPRQVAAVPLLDHRARVAAWALAVVLIAALVAIGIVVLGSRGSSASGGQTGRTQPLSGTGPGTGTTQPPTTSATGTTTQATTARVAALELVAKRGGTWLSVRAGSANGKVLFENTLASGHHLRFARRRLWVRVGAPWNLGLAAAGHPLAVPLHATGDMLVTAAGARPAA